MILILGLTACAPITPNVPSPTFQVPSATPQATIPPTPTLNLPTPTPTEHRSLITVCSPLAVLPLNEIPPYITQPFIAPGPANDAEHPEWTQKDDGHHGTDIGYYKRDGKLFTGTPVLAALNGRIAAIVHDRPPYGNMLIIETPFDGIPPALVERQHIPNSASLYTLYAHLQNLQSLTLGSPVACGRQIAETGLTGFTGGPHLHFETRWGPPNQIFNAMAYYRADATKEEMDNYTTWRMKATYHLFDAMELLAVRH